MSPMTTAFTDSEKRLFRGASFVPNLAVPLVDFSGRALGPRVVQLTPWRANLLALHDSPYLRGAAATRLQLLQALYFFSPEFEPGGNWRFKWFVIRWWLLPFAKADSALRRWRDAQFSEANQIPREIKTGQGQAVADLSPQWLAEFVRSCMKVLQLSEQEVLHMPYNRLFSYLAVEGQGAPGMPKFGANAKKHGAYLRAKIAKKTQPTNP